MRRLLKIVGWGLGGLAVLILVLGAALMMWGNTNTGRAAIERLTYRLTDGRVTVAGLAGSFPSHLRIERLELRDAAGLWLSAERIVLDWSPLSIAESRLQIDNVQAARVDMQRLPHGASTSKNDEASIPRIDVARLKIDVLELGSQLAGAPAALVVSANAHLRSLHDMLIEATAQRTDGEGDYAINLRFDPRRMDAALKLHEPANGPLENILSLPGLGALDATLKLNGPRTAEQLEASIQAGGLSGHAQGSVNVDELSGDLDVAFETSAMSPRADLRWDRAILRATWHGNIKSPTAKGHLEIAGLAVPGGVQLAALSADLDADLGSAGLHALLSGLRIPGQLPRLLENDSIRIEASMRLDDPTRPVELTASHRLFSLRAHALTVDKPGANVELRLPDLMPFGAYLAQDIRGSAIVNAQLDGYPAAPHVKLGAIASLAPGEQIWSSAVGDRARLQLSGTLKGHSFAVEDLKFLGSAVSLSANGAISDQGIKSRWSFEFSDLGAVSPILAGTLTASGSLDGPIMALNAEASMRAAVSVRGSPEGSLSAAVKLSGLPSSPRGTLTAQGTFDEAPLQVDIALERGPAHSLHAVVHQANWKSAHANGDITLALDGGQALGRFDLTVGQLKDLQNLLGVDIAGSLTANLALHPDHERTRLQLQVDAKEIVLSRLTGSVEASADGFTDSLGINARVQLPDLGGAAATLAAKGNLNLEAREVSIASLRLHYRGQDARLLAPARVQFASGISVDVFKLGAQGAEFVIQGQIAPELALRASLKGVGPALVNAFVPDFLASGSIEAHADLRGSADSPTGEVAVTAEGIRRADDAALGLPMANMQLTAQLRGHTADIDARLSAGSASQLSAVGQVPIALDGTIDVKINGKYDIGMVNPFLEARGLHATGELDIDAAVAGSVAEPQISGSLNLTNGSLRDYARGISVSNIAAKIVGERGMLQIESFTASAAPGTLSMTGTVGVLQPHIPVDLKIAARNAQPIASKLVTSNLNADLSVSGTARERLDVAGTVHLNRTLVGIPNSLPPNVAVLDVRRRGQKAAPVPEKPLVIGLDVSVQAPQEILVQGRGLDAEMGGELHLGGTTATPLVSGGFDLHRGSFSLGSSRLNFTAGRVAFNGAGLKNKIDPTLDFTAQATVADNTTATMHITGLADAPEFEFTSSPTMPQDEIMAYLLFGVPVQSLTPIQMAQIGYALASLSGVGGDGSLNPLVKLQRSLGLDRLTIGPGTTTTTAAGTDSTGASIEAGRYISKRVYIEAKQTTAGTAQVGAVVDLTKHLKLQTRLGNGAATVQGTTPENDPGSSIGLLYQFEY
jgi:translocation and assembly module TamB